MFVTKELRVQEVGGSWEVMGGEAVELEDHGCSQRAINAIIPATSAFLRRTY